MKMLTKAQNAVSTLTKCTDLSLDGNPLSFEEGYKYAIIRSCREIKFLDGEEVFALDKDLGDDFAMADFTQYIEDEDEECEDQVGNSSSNSNSNSYSNSNSNSNIDNQMKDKLKFNIKSKSNDPTSSPRCNGINSDPVLLTYRAAAILSDLEIATSDKMDNKSDEIQRLADEISQNSKKSRSFVGKLRGTSVSKNSNSQPNSRPSSSNSTSNGSSNSNSNINSNNNSNNDDVMNAAKLLGANDIKYTDLDGASSDEDADEGASGEEEIDMQNPWEIIRRLVVKCETSETENSLLKRHLAEGDQYVGGGGGMDAELRSLRLELQNATRENANMYLLSDENKKLKKECVGLREEISKLSTNKRLIHPDDNSSYNTGYGGGAGAETGAWSTPYPDVATPRSSSSRGSNSNSNSRPGSKNSSRPTSASLYDSFAVDRPTTATERIESGYIASLREEAGLVEINPSDGDNEYMAENSDDDEDLEILNLMERNENVLASLRGDLLAANKQFDDEERRIRALASNAGVDNKTTKTTTTTSTTTTTTKGSSVRELLELRRRGKMK